MFDLVTRGTGAGTDLLGLHNRISNPLSDGPTFWPMQYRSIATAWTPAVDIFETDEFYQIVAEIPGMDPDQLSVSVRENVLTIHGEKVRTEPEGGRAHLCERSFGSFERSFTLPTTVEGDVVNAGYENGVLTVTLSIPESTLQTGVQE